MPLIKHKIKYQLQRRYIFKGNIFTWVAWRMAERFRCLNPRKKWTAGFAKPISPVEDSFVCSSQAYNTSSALIPWSTRSRCPVKKVKIPRAFGSWLDDPNFLKKKGLPVSICHTYTVPSLHPTIRKSSKGRHFIVTTGNKCLEAKTTHFLSDNPNRVTEWSLATLHMHFWILGYK